MQGIIRPYAAWDIADFVFDDDFVITMTSQFWTAVSGNSGTATVGVGTLTTGAVDLYTGAGAANNDEVYYYGLKTATLKTGAAFRIMATLQYTEANTDDCNIVMGFSKTAPIAGFLVNGNGGVNTTANDDGFYIEKIGNTTVWKAVAQWSAASFAQATASNSTSVFTVRQVIAIDVVCGQNLVAEATYYVYYIPSGGTPTPLTDPTGIVPAAIRFRFPFTGSTNLLPVLGVKTGGTNAETVTFDRVSIFALRA